MMWQHVVVSSQIFVCAFSREENSSTNILKPDVTNIALKFEYPKRLND